MLIRRACWLIALIPSLAVADVQPATIRVPEKPAWTGQRIPFFVELRARGSFEGAASFSLPQVQRSVIIKVGNPVVSSEEIEGDSWFVQTHEFALFSQQSGVVTIPPFEVRFSSRDGFTGPVNDQTATVPEAKFDIRRPPGSDQAAFLVTVESIDISESWDPQPGPAQVGAIFKRTIAQHADEMTGIALAPPPQVAPDGVRVYLGDPKVTDTAERGTLSGERRDTITYVLQEPGAHSLPAITYVWWNPKTEELGSKTLPAVAFDVQAPQVASTPQAKSDHLSHGIWWLAGAVLLCVVVWRREWIVNALRLCLLRYHPPHRVAARRLLRACRRNDATAASQAWLKWLELQPPEITPNDSLAAAATGMERHIYGPPVEADWRGTAMAEAFRSELADRRQQTRRNRESAVPELNPSS